MKSWYVPKNAPPITLIEFLSRNLSLSRRGIKRLIDQNLCRINGQMERFSTTQLRGGENISLEIIEEPKPLMTTLFEDEWIKVVNKPSGVLSTSCGKWLAHRLDKETSGLLILAKDESTQQMLHTFFREREVEKHYLALVDGVPQESLGEIETFHGVRHSYQGQKIWGSVSKTLGKWAKTRWERLLSGRDASLLRCSLETGRTHQIRAHLSEIGHPILGDRQYCTHFHCVHPAKRVLLHAESVRFMHPVEKNSLFLTAEPPQDFQQAIERLF